MKTNGHVASSLDEFDFDVPGSAIDEAAAHWLVRMTSGHATAEERAAFARWRAADPAHEAALSTMRALWAEAPSGAPAQPAMPAVVAAPRARARRGRRAWRWALAASLLIGVVLGHQAWTQWRFDAATAPGELRTLALSDGSTVILSGDTALDVDMRPDVRRIVLARGEAYFDVQHDAARPFVVDTGFGEARDIGTAFSVRREAGFARVTVASGRVEVHHGDDAATLDAGQQLTLDAKPLGAVETVDADKALAWHAGRLVLDQVTLDEAARALNRYRRGRVIVLVPSQRQHPFNTVIELDHVDAWLMGVERQGWGRVVRLGPLTAIY